VKRAIELRAPWMAKEEAETLLSDYTAINRRLWPSREDLRDKLRLPSIDRHKLRAWVIPPYDRSDKQLERDRKNKKLARKARSRMKAGAVERSIYERNSLSQTKPWEAEGKSRATWFRHQKKVRQVWGQRHAGTKQVPAQIPTQPDETGMGTANLNIICPHTCLTHSESQFLQQREAQPCAITSSSSQASSC
jgi:hypothetical protein